MLVPVKEYTSAADLRADIERRHNRKRQPSYGMRPEPPKPPPQPPPQPPPEPPEPSEPPPPPGPKFEPQKRGGSPRSIAIPSVAPPPPCPPMPLIVSKVAHFYGYQTHELASTSRKMRLCFARHVGMYMCRLLTRRSTTAISKQFNKDHTSALHGCARIAAMVADNPRLAEDITNLTARINAAFSGVPLVTTAPEEGPYGRPEGYAASPLYVPPARPR